MTKLSPERQTPYIVRARISESWFDQLLLAYLVSLAAHAINQDREAGSQQEEPRTPSSKTINRFYDALGAYIYDRTVTPILERATSGDGGADIDPAVLLEAVLSGAVPAQFHAAMWRGEELDIAVRFSEATNRLSKNSRSVYRTPKSLLGRSTLYALEYTRLHLGKEMFIEPDQGKRFFAGQRDTLKAWLRDEPLNLQTVEQPKAQAGKSRLPVQRKRPAKNEYIENSRFSNEMTLILIFNFLEGRSAQETFERFQKEDNFIKTETIPSTKTINKIYRRLGHYLFERFYTVDVEQTSGSNQEAFKDKEQHLQERAQSMLQEALAAMPYETYRIIDPEGDVSSLNPDINVEVRKIYARRKGLADDPRTVIALARMRSEYAGFTNDASNKPTPSTGKAANDDIWAMQFALMSWLQVNNLKLS